MPYSIEQLKTIISPIAEKHGVERVSLFGSYSKGLATSKSDVDLIIEKGRLRTLFQLSGFRLDLEDALNLPVDLITAGSGNRDFLEIISKDEVLLYRNTRQNGAC